MPLRVEPLRTVGKDLRFGATVHGVDVSRVDDACFAQLRDALWEHSLLVLPGQGGATPGDHVALIRRFDPAATSVWRDQRTNPWERHKAEHLGGAGTFMLPDPYPEVLVLGKGEVRDHWGLTATLGGARAAYGRTKGSQVIGGGALQWHIDGAFWRAHPPLVTSMRCVEAPGSADEEHVISYGDGAALTSPYGATAFASARVALDLLTPQERAHAERATARYAAHPFKRFARCGSTRDGLVPTAGGEGEVAAADLAGAVAHPLVWRHPRTGHAALMPQTRCIEGLGFPGGVEVGLDETRRWLHGLMRRAVAPELVYAHRWRPGDIVLWDNWAVWHSATGALRDGDRRVQHLVAFDGSVAPTATPHSAL